MGSVTVITDSSACVPQELASGLRVATVPLRFNLNGRSYRDGIDIDADEVYRRLPRLDVLPTTSAPTPSDYYAVLQAVAAHVSDIVVITISRRFSAAHDSALAAAATARDTLGNISVHVVDSGTAAGAQGLVVLEAARAAARGCAVDDVIASAHRVMSRVELVAFLDTLYYIARSGRVPVALHYTNAIFRVNPLFMVKPLSGEARVIRIARGRASAQRQLLEVVGRRVAGGPLCGIVLHSYCRDEAERLADHLKSSFDCRELHISDFTPAMGIHAGPGVLGLAYYPV